MYFALQSFDCNITMAAGGHDETDRIRATPIKEVFEIGKTRHPETLSHRCRPLLVDIDDSDEAGSKYFRINSSMMMAKVAYSDDANPDGLHENHSLKETDGAFSYLFSPFSSKSGLPESEKKRDILACLSPPR
jgi:hypothetical protein